MFENKITNILLDIIPQNHWNTLSNLLCRLAPNTIGSPIQFSLGNFTLQEFLIPRMDNALKEQFLQFCYPADLPDRENEIKLDQQYWNDAATFIVSDQNSEIAGCLQFIPKTATNKIPVEYARVVDAPDSDNAVNPAPPSGTFAEIYRCRRSNALKGEHIIGILTMLFKAMWIKTVQTNTEYVYITYDRNDRELRNLYLRKLFFQNPGITVTFGNCHKLWNLLYKDCLLNEQTYATLSRSQFYLQTWVRKNCKKKNLSLPPRTTTAEIFSADETVLFTTVVGTKKMSTCRHKSTTITAENSAG